MLEPEPEFTLGIEEEYFLVDRTTRDVVGDPPDGMLAKYEALLGAQVSPEFLRSQIEIGTRVCTSLDEARDDFRRLRDYDMTWRSDARRFEFITLPFQEFAGMNASLELFFELGLDAVYAHVETLAGHIVDWARSASSVTLVTPGEPARRAGIVCVRPRNGERASESLEARGVVHSFREGNIRLSPHIYNTADDVGAALELMSS